MAPASPLRVMIKLQKIWDVESGVMILTLIGHISSVIDAAGVPTAHSLPLLAEIAL